MWTTCEENKLECGSDQAKYLAMIAICVSAVNVVGGFLVSHRMLGLFKKKGVEDHSYLYLIAGVVLVIVAFTNPNLRDSVNSLCGILCVMSIGGLAAMSTANAGCKFGIVGVFSSLACTFASFDGGITNMNVKVGLALMAVGGLGGLAVGGSVSPIKLPQTVAAFHSLVGLAAMCTSIGSFACNPKAGISMENIASVLGDFIGGVTFTGSIIAF